MSLRRTTFHRVLHRPSLFLGGEREPLMIAALLLGGMALSAQNLLATVLCVTLWLSLLWAFRTMAKRDPILTQVYLRQLKYRDDYPSRSRPCRRR